MRFMIVVKASEKSETGVMPTEDQLAVMGSFHEELAKAGVLVDATGLKPSSEGWRVQYQDDDRTLIEGPFDGATNLIAGFTVIDVASREEAVKWSMRYPNPASSGAAEIEVRAFYELDDFEDSPAIQRFRDLEAERKS